MSETADLVIDLLRSIFDDYLTPEARRSGSATPPPGLWEAIDRSGLTTLGHPDSGAGLEELVAVATAVGQAAAPVPLVEMAGLATWLASTGGLDLRPGLTTIAGLAPSDSLRLVREGGSWRVTGTLRRVPWGSQADTVVALAVDGLKTKIILLGAASRVSRRRNLAGEPRDTLTYEGSCVDTTAISDVDIDVGLVRRRAALLRSASIAGAIEEVLDMTLRYADERHQFGRPISRFQAVQAHLVAIAEESACATMAVQTAVLDPHPERGPLCAISKITTGRAAQSAAASAHQVHGAIGTTEEHPLQLFTTRLWSWQDEYGSGDWWADRLGRHAIAVGASDLWPMMSSPHMGLHQMGT